MSKTLFLYVFRDLVKIFLMTSAVLAGIMSFGGLLKPMTQYGLNASQVGKMLAYFMPATQTYSLPIAALFATTVVYGRLSSDNELTACRAGGISHLAMAVPALVLGLILSIVSLLCLSYIVPRYTLKVEKVAFESLAEIVQKNIERNHQLRLENQVIYAESAEIVPPPADRPNDEVVVLHGPMFCTYEEVVGEDGRKTKVPSEFYTASRAVVVMRSMGEQVEFTAHLEDGSAFPRELKGAEAGAVGTTQFGPYPVASPIKENTKFMDIKQLQRLYADPTRSREVSALFTGITHKEQDNQFLAGVQRQLFANFRHDFVGVAEGRDQETYSVLIEPDVRIAERGTSRLVLQSRQGARDIRLQRSRGGEVVNTDDAYMLHLRVSSNSRNDQVRVEFQLHDVLVGTDDGRPGHRSFSRRFLVSMPPELVQLEDRRPDFYLRKTDIKGEDVTRLRRTLPRLRNTIEAEIHGRVSFAVSCFILVLVGCALGMMFRTGNYLSAFALSVIPALFCIALIVTGQHVSSHATAGDLRLGLSVIWSGNVMVAALAVGLLGHLRRQ